MNIKTLITDCPIITQHPSDGTIPIGGEYTLTCSAKGGGTVKYSWEIQVFNEWTSVDINMSCYTTSTCGTYQCVVSNEVGSVKSNVVEVKFQSEYI